MINNYFFLHFAQVEQNVKNDGFLNKISDFANSTKQNAFVIDTPLGDEKYSYEYTKAFLLLIPKYKILFFNFGDNEDSFDEFFDDFVEDIGSISDKYRYKDTIGRPKAWKKNILEKVEEHINEIDNISEFLASKKLLTSEEERTCELIISLLTGSINDIDKVSGRVPDNLLDKIKHKILLFDGEQTRFIYQKNDKKVINIQGLSGTGKTELLLHKLKEIYLKNDNSKIMFTCHNKILASSLRNRIPEFFNFMKVERQIKWDERLWCVHGWGSKDDPDSGAYRYICKFYKIDFFRYSSSISFEKACSLALEEIKSIKSIQKENFQYAFDFMLIDESQDFPEVFFDICKLITKNTIYIAGDIFQNIFDTNLVKNIQPEFLLRNCYRTDPRTLMFAHGIGMGLFESTKISWLEDLEWELCGYIVDKLMANKTELYHFKREPIRRFEDLNDNNEPSVELVEFEKKSITELEEKIIEIINSIKNENPTVKVEDIGIVFIDDSANNKYYTLADKLEQTIFSNFGWNLNKAYKSKQKIKNTLFFTNKNNVKGLEFSFIICLTDIIMPNLHYRNALYMMLSRSFIKTYFLYSKRNDNKLTNALINGLSCINKNGFMEILPPTKSEIEKIRTTIKNASQQNSLYEIFMRYCDDFEIKRTARQKMLNAYKAMIEDGDFSNESIIEFIRTNIKWAK